MKLPTSLRPALLFAGLSGLSLGGHLLWAQLTVGGGFPLDDAWIHQTYARNLAYLGEWSFIPGEISGGSTAPLWSALLVPGYWLNRPYLWTFALGWFGLAFSAWLGYVMTREYLPDKPWAAWLVGFGMSLEWHLVWAGVSGMETGAFTAIVLAVCVGLALGWLRDWRLGMMIGVAVWLRPDGVTLWGPVLFAFGLPLVSALYSEGRLSLVAHRGRLLRLLWMLLGFGIVFGLYLLFNRLVAGAWWPNTLSAKQAEYDFLTQAPYLPRFLKLASVLLVGVGVLVLPGFIWLGGRALRRADWPLLGAWLWVLGYIGLYAWRLPVIYQHGRYLMPAMGVYILFGLLGTMVWLQPGSSRFVVRLASRTWLAAACLVLLAFYGMGARSYARDVEFIEREMVAPAHWIAAHAPADALIAAHDIGALGYFGQRRILDLAGLISPEVIPIIRAEERLAKMMDDSGADYLITFPGWYPQLVLRGELLFQTVPRVGWPLEYENMAVYRWR